MHSGLTERKVGKYGRFMEPLLGWHGVGHIWMGLSGGCELARMLSGCCQRRRQGRILFGQHSVLGVKGETHLKLQPSPTKVQLWCHYLNLEQQWVPGSATQGLEVIRGQAEEGRSRRRPKGPKGFQAEDRNVQLSPALPSLLGVTLTWTTLQVPLQGGEGLCLPLPYPIPSPII